MPIAVRSRCRWARGASSRHGSRLSMTSRRFGFRPSSNGLRSGERSRSWTTATTVWLKVSATCGLLAVMTDCSDGDSPGRRRDDGGLDRHRHRRPLQRAAALPRRRHDRECDLRAPAARFTDQAPRTSLPGTAIRQPCNGRDSTSVRGQLSKLGSKFPPYRRMRSCK